MKKLYTLFVLFFFALTVKSQLPCTANFTNASIGNTVNFSPDVSTTPDSLYIINHWWSFGDGSSSQLSYPSHTYAQCGTYTVYHITRTYDSNRTVICGDTVIQAITIACNTPCGAQAYFQAWSDSVQSNLYEFTNNSTVTSPNTGTITSVWNFGDGVTATSTGLINQTHTYSTGGTYTVCLMVYISQTPGTVSCADSFCQNIQVVIPNQNPCNIQASFTSVNSNNQPNSYAFINTTNAPDSSSISNSFWIFGDGSPIVSTTGLANQSHEYALPGVYQVCLITTMQTPGTIDCRDTVCQQISVSASTDSITSTPLISFPNPAQSNVNVSVSLNQASSIYATVYNAQSRLVSQLVLPGHEGDNVLSFNISNLPAGLYTIRMYCGNQVYVSRFQKL